MAKKGIDLTAEKVKAIASIKAILNDLEQVFDNRDAEIVNKLTNANIDLERIKAKTEESRKKALAYEKQIGYYSRMEEDLKEREQRIRKTEELLEKEKKLITAKKQHNIEWESQLREKERRLNG